jgi:hypothetical protein
MEFDYSTAKTPAFPEYVLAVIRDMHRQQCQYDCGADPDATLTFETTVAEWRVACDLVPWRQLAKALNAEWAIKASAAEWKVVLKPERKRRLLDVCEFLARRSTRQEIRPARLLGVPCTTAGAFLTIRSMRYHAGAAAEEITPSTPLAPYTQRYPHVFLTGISKLAPEALPPVHISGTLYDTATLAVPAATLAGWLVWIAGYVAGSWELQMAGGVVSGLVYLFGWVAPFCSRPATVTFGSLRIFRDLAIVLASEAGGGTPGFKKPLLDDSWDRW